MNNQEFEGILNNYKKMYSTNSGRVEKYQYALNIAITNDDDKKIEVYSKIIATLKEAMKMQKAYIDYARLEIKNDILERMEIKENFPKIIDEIIPDNVPYVFHGNNNIGMVFEIIKTGGLFPPNERGLGFRSTASGVDVTWKKNISVTCEFADSGNMFFPYGAIFVFLPLDNEKERVLNTGQNSEVAQGLSGVNFRKNPERLIGIITTSENKERIQQWCLEYQIDSNKVFTHLEFINKCQNSFFENIDRNISKK